MPDHLLAANLIDSPCLAVRPTVLPAHGINVVDVGEDAIEALLVGLVALAEGVALLARVGVATSDLLAGRQVRWASSRGRGVGIGDRLIVPPVNGRLVLGKSTQT